ncbi:MAG: mechanosensitive ion channel family protein [Cellulomonadaceae bacterium]
MSLETTPLQATTPSPTPDPSPSQLLDQVTDQLRDPGENSSWTDWLVGAPLRILIIAVVGTVALALLRRGIRLVTEHAARAPRTEAGEVLSRITPLSSERRAGRARTLGSVLRSSANVIVGSLMVLMILDQLDINLAPLLASAGVAGVALGFGAQSLVKDFLSGIFLLLEDQFGVGDVVDFGDVVGTVESVALRVTTVRDFTGTLWYLRNGEIIRTGNRTQGWSLAVADMRVGYDQDVDQVLALLNQAAAQVRSDTELSAALLAAPTVIGPVDLRADSAHFQITVKTVQGMQDPVSRALRAKSLEALRAAGIPLATVPWNPDV